MQKLKNYLLCLLCICIPFASKTQDETTVQEDSAQIQKEEDKINPFKDAKWFSKECGALQVELQTNQDGGTSANFANSSSALVYIEKKRSTFRPDKQLFNKKLLSFDTTFNCSGNEAVKCCIFIKNIDGFWYQSKKIFLVEPGKKTTLTVNLDPNAMELSPEGQLSTWNGLDKATAISYGINIFDGNARAISVELSAPRFEEELDCPDLYVYDLQFPKEIGKNSLFEARFKLSREYFNPFDPDEIKVDAVFLLPNFSELTRPAFYTRQYKSELRMNLQTRIPYGRPEWALRFTPEISGTHKFKIIVRDNNSTIETNWQLFNVNDSKNPGFIRVSKDDLRYFEYTNGEFFFPIGFNIHSVKDLRSENKLKIGYRPDRGIYAYEEYFDAMSANGLNAAEIWMAAWSFAIEWTSSRTDYYGLGRYNLYNAWRLDHVLNHARKKRIKIHLVLDNHGKLSSHCDPEWNDSPHNKSREFAIADNAMLDKPNQFFYNEEAEKYYLKRNRYIAARWGADPNIFGIEFWSEIDLITDMKQTYNDDSSVKWHKKMSEQLDSFGVRNLMTTHTCGDFNHPITYRKYYEEIPLISYIVGDAYTDKTPIVEHMKKHSEKLKFFNKPLLITEYGGSPQGAALNKLEADLHGGIWSSLFLEQAGTPFLWWHDFIHDKHKYMHFYGFSRFMQDVDPRNKKFRHRELKIFNTSDNSINNDLSCLAAGNETEHYAWVFSKEAMIVYPDDPESEDPIQNQAIELEALHPNSKYEVKFLDTLDAHLILSQIYSTDQSGLLKLNLPDFKTDLAIKINLSE